MSHSVIIYPNGMVEVTTGYDNDEDDLDTENATFVENTEEDEDLVSDALDVLDEHFAAAPVVKKLIEVIRDLAWENAMAAATQDGEAAMKVG